MKRLEEHLQIALCSFNMYQKNSSVRRVKQLFEKKTDSKSKNKTENFPLMQWYWIAIARSINCEM